MLSLFPLVSSHWLTITVVITEPHLSPFHLLCAAAWSCHTGDGTRLRHTRRTSVVTTHESRHHATITSLLGRSCDMITIRYGWGHDNNPIWMRHGIWHGHVLDIWPCVLLLQSPALPRYLGWWPFLHYHPYCCTASYNITFCVTTKIMVTASYNMMALHYS